MDYSILNEVINEIIAIVNRYNNDKNYSYEVCESLVISLFGYYMFYGESIFERIDTVLGALKIHGCQNKEEYEAAVGEINKSIPEDYSERINYVPFVMWDCKYNEMRKFIGAVPHIVYKREDVVQDATAMMHELSHTLEGTGGFVVSEEKDEFYLNQGFTNVKVDKTDNSLEIMERGMSELVAVSTTNRIIREFLKLDASKIDNEIIRNFIERLVKYRRFETLVDSYGALSVALKDLMDNEDFMNVVKDYFYSNDEFLFIDAYEALGEGISYYRLKKTANRLISCKLNEAFYYVNMLRQDIDKIYKKKGIIPEKRLLIVI